MILQQLHDNRRIAECVCSDSTDCSTDCCSQFYRILIRNLTPGNNAQCSDCESECCFFFNDTATTEIYTLSLHDALPFFLEEHTPHLHSPFYLLCRLPL